jgi:hypothetical protein
MPKEHSSLEYKLEYRTRAIVMAESVSFKGGENDKSELWLEVVRTLLLESCFSYSANSGASHSKNMELVREMIRRSDFLNRPIRGYGRRRAAFPSDQYCAIQLVRLSVLDIGIRCLLRNMSL